MELPNDEFDEELVDIMASPTQLESFALAADDFENFFGTCRNDKKQEKIRQYFPKLKRLSISYT